MSRCKEIFAHRLLFRAGKSLALGAMLVGFSYGAALSQSGEPADATKIVIGQSSTGVGQMPLYVALQEGFFKKAGVDASSFALSGGTPSAMAAFATGSVNVLNLSAPEVIQYAGKKVITGKAFGEIVDQSYDIISSKAITSIQEIKGKTVGISAPNSGDQIILLATMQHYGISPKDVTFITSGNSINRIVALDKGVIHVTAAANSQRKDSMKVGTVLLNSGDNPVQFPTTVLIASGDLISNHKPLLKKFLSALGEATAWMRANPEAAVALCVKTLGATVDACTSAIALNFDRSISGNWTWSSTFAVNVEGVKSALAVMATLDPETKNLTIDDVVDTSIAGTTP